MVDSVEVVRGEISQNESGRSKRQLEVHNSYCELAEQAIGGTRPKRRPFDANVTRPH